MEIKSLRCNHCSANLEIDPKIKFFNCNYCGSSLTIKRTGTTVYTEVIDEIKNNTDILVDRSDQLLLEKEIERLDREWQLHREQYGVRDKEGTVRYPDKSNQLNDTIAGGVAILVAVGLSIAFINFPASELIPAGIREIVKFLPVFFIVVLLFRLYSGSSNKQRYQTAKDEYIAKRGELLRQLKG